MTSHKRQRDVAAAIGGSQSTISRMELGRGAAMSLATWAAAADAVGRRLVVDLVDVTEGVVADGRLTLARRCHRAVADLARAGSWSAVTEIQVGRASEHIETILTRRDTDVAVVHVWDLVSDVGVAIDELLRSLERVRQDAAGHRRVGGVIIVPSGLRNRRRMTEAAEDLQVACPTLGAHWYRALVREARPMPDQPGVLWATRDGDRLLPAPLLPGWMWVAPDRASKALRRRRG